MEIRCLGLKQTCRCLQLFATSALREFHTVMNLPTLSLSIFFWYPSEDDTRIQFVSVMLLLVLISHRWKADVPAGICCNLCAIVCGVECDARGNTLSRSDCKAASSGRWCNCRTQWIWEKHTKPASAFLLRVNGSTNLTEFYYPPRQGGYTVDSVC